MNRGKHWIPLIRQHRDARDSRGHLLQQLEPPGSDLGVVEAEPGDVPARPREALDEPGADRLAHDHDNRNRARCVFGCTRGRRGPRKEDVDLEPGELTRELGEPFQLALSGAVLYDQILPLHIVELA